MVSTAPSGTDRLQVTVSIQTNAGTLTNSLSQLRFGVATNALVDIPAGATGATGSFNVTMPAGTTQTTFVVRRAVAGQSATAPFTVLDRRGDWSTFVGGGPSAF